jgi:hypothetical protein
MKIIFFIASFVAMGTLAAFVTRGYFIVGDKPSETTGFISGPQVGAKVPGPFEPFNINGEKAGEESCLFCRYGNAPVVMIFASKPTEPVIALLQTLEKIAAEARKTEDYEVGVCLVMTQSNDEIKKSLTQLSNKENYKHVVLGMIDPQFLKRYRLNAEAEVTVLLYSNQVVRVNHAYKSGELTEKVARDIGDETAAFLAAR